nr:ABC transporter substrate-binding protein [Candidatus Dadabacteria bacterium]NIS08971.1 ABC transporter substrate-binding protein [Candidatus Dadabacteria bacterium]NIV42653.1 ABC transporter substrate-binding protein [Candidatus Dadabacteria bacterium]NIX15522.1 ABC transporter substrate-binding protein [Candidatus Dadabacteria bacterium]NIY22278.1 ABC transporter substrate-binding protein [Candidatus Dadabacteria bacterium]
MDKITVGFPISLSGKYSLQGKESLEGIKLWQAKVNSDNGIFVKSLNKKLPLELVYVDDKSSAEKCKEVTLGLINHDKVDLLLGPYSSGLTVAIAPITKKYNRVVWNYGGATDEITEKGYTNFINAITPSSHYYQGIIELFANRLQKDDKKLAVVFASDSGFSKRVKDGATEFGLENKFSVFEYGYKSGSKDFTDVVEGLINLKADLILGVGRMHDDLNFAK